MTLGCRTIGILGLALACGSSCGRIRPEQAWEERLSELRPLALHGSAERLSWELLFEALHERTSGSERFDVLTYAPHRSLVIGMAEPRFLEPLERRSLEDMGSELAGLDEILAELRALPLEELGWHGEECPKLLLTREISISLCGRAWLALEERDERRALDAWTDALRLARALDDGTAVGTSIRGFSEGFVLGSVRSALALGLRASLARQELLPFYGDWGRVRARAAHAIRRDLSSLWSPESLEWLGGPAEALAWCRGVEEALVRAREPSRAFFETYEPVMDRQRFVIAELHRRHAWRNVAFSALAVAAHRETSGRFPATLAAIAELEPEMRLDPWTGTDLRYEVTSSEARIGPPAGGDFRSPVFAVWTLR